MTMKRLEKKNNAEVFYHSIWFGLLTGLVEGVLLFALHHSAWLTWRLQNRAYWYETLWIAPLVDLILFSLVGGFFALAGWVLPRLPIKRIAWFTFIFLAVFDWMFILLFERILLIVILLLAVGISMQIFNIVMKHTVSLSPKLQKTWPWLAGLAFAIFIVIQGGGWLSEMIGTMRLH